MTVINFSRFMRPAVKGWSQDELASLYRAHNFLQQSGMPVGFEQGSTDIGEPWCVFFDLRSEDVVAHFARNGGQYVIAGGVLESAVWGNTLSEATHVFYKAVDNHVELSKTRGRSNVVMHPATKLIFSLSTLFFLLQLDKADAETKTTDGHSEGSENTHSHSGSDQKSALWFPRSFVNTEFTGQGINAALMGLFLAQAAAADDAEQMISNQGFSETQGLETGSISTAETTPLVNNGVNLQDLTDLVVVTDQSDDEGTSALDANANPIDTNPFIVFNFDAPETVILTNPAFDQTVLPSIEGVGDEFSLFAKTDAITDDTTVVEKVSFVPTDIVSNSSATGFLENRLLSVVDLTAPIVLDNAGLTAEFADFFEFGIDISGLETVSSVDYVDPVRSATSANASSELPKLPDNILSASQKEDTIVQFVRDSGDVEIFVYEGNIFIVDAEVKLSGTSDFYVENIRFDDDSQISLIGLGNAPGGLELFA